MQPKKKNGRPPVKSTMTDLQREIKNKVLKFTTPYFEAVLAKQLELAGVKKEDTKESVKITEDSKPEASVPYTVQNAAVTSYIKTHIDALKLVYGVDKEGIISNLPDEDDSPKPMLASVSKLSLTVQNKD